MTLVDKVFVTRNITINGVTVCPTTLVSHRSTVECTSLAFPHNLNMNSGRFNFMHSFLTKFREFVMFDPFTPSLKGVNVNSQ